MAAVPAADAGVDHLPATKIKDSRGKFIPLPEGVLGDFDSFIDRRLRGDLTWIARRFPQVYIGEGYAGPLPSGGWAGCHGCHVSDSDHKIGMAVDIYPIGWDGRGCDRSWKQVTRLARLAEPRQDQTTGPFSWVGYDGDENHGCGHHLHLSWNHADDYKRHRPTEWVEVFDLKN